MEAAFTLATAGPEPEPPRCPGFDLACAPPEPCTPAELRAIVLGGENESAACEQLLAQVARAEGALELAFGGGLAALDAGDRLIQLGYSCLGDYAREVLGLGERKAQAMSRLARELRARPLLREAVLAGDVRIRSAQTVLPVARGAAEARWVERARTETVRALERAVREERAGCHGEDEEEAWTRLSVRLAPQNRAIVDEALGIAGRLLPGSSRAQRLEAMAQEFLGAFPVEAGDDGGAPGLAALGPNHAADGARAVEAAERREQLEARLEAETERWSFLPAVPRIAAPDAGPDALASAAAIDVWLRKLAAKRDRWDALLGYCAYAVRRSGLLAAGRLRHLRALLRRAAGARAPDRRAAGRAREATLGGAGAPGGAGRRPLVREAPAARAPPGPRDHRLGAARAGAHVCRAPRRPRTPP